MRLAVLLGINLPLTINSLHGLLMVLLSSITLYESWSFQNHRKTSRVCKYEVGRLAWDTRFYLPPSEIKVNRTTRRSML